MNTFINDVMFPYNKEKIMNYYTNSYYVRQQKIMLLFPKYLMYNIKQILFTNNRISNYPEIIEGDYVGTTLYGYNEFQYGRVIQINRGPPIEFINAGLVCGLDNNFAYSYLIELFESRNLVWRGHWEIYSNLKIETICFKIKLLEELVSQFTYFVYS